MINQRKAPLTEQEIVDRAEGRKWRNSTWTFAYRIRQRALGTWSLIFLLLFALLALLPVYALLCARYCH